MMSGNEPDVQPRHDGAVSKNEPGRKSVRGWVARFGVAGFLFFLVKGLMWLIVPALVVAFR